MSAENDIDEWWQSIRFIAIGLEMDDLLPPHWLCMRDVGSIS
jgi:hypothetical protein